MDLHQSIDLNKTALARIVAGLFALLGLTDGSVVGSVLGRIPGKLHRTIARVLRPAESAVRRLIVLVAMTIKVKASPARPNPARPNPAGPMPERPMPERPMPARSMPAGLARAGQGKPRLSFQLFDPPQQFLPQTLQPKTGPCSQPRISFFGDGEVRTISLAPEPPPKDDKVGDGLENPAHLLRRLQALKAALDDLPRQARRLTRTLARRQKLPHVKFKRPLRPGHAPGFRRRPQQEIDRVLHECDWLAREALPPDTS